MISTLFKSFKLTIAFSLLFSICYIFVLWIFAQVAGPNKGNAEVLELDGKVVGAANVGQNFTEDIYFWGRPSCAGDGYDASSSPYPSPTCGGRDRARINTSTSKAMKPPIISRPDWLIRFPWRNFPSPLPGTLCLPDRTRTRTAIRTILPTSNSIIRSV